MKRDFRGSSAVTLVELLIAVAIIALLAAITAPTYLEARTRSKVARVRSDLRTIGMALEAYANDTNGKYPDVEVYRRMLQYGQTNRASIMCVTNLTTPVAYLSSVRFIDPFCNVPQGSNDYGALPLGSTDGTTDFNIGLVYINVQLYWSAEKRIQPMQPAGRSPWMLLSLGPDAIKGPSPFYNGSWPLYMYADNNDPTGLCRYAAWNYDPSNGTVSKGDILRQK